MVSQGSYREQGIDIDFFCANAYKSRADGSLESEHIIEKCKIRLNLALSNNGVKIMLPF